MRIDLSVPKVNSNDDYVKILRWYVKDGAAVRKGDIIVDFETSKATFEFEAEHDGFVKQSSAEEETVAIGAVIGYLFSTVEELNSYSPSEGSGVSAEKKQKKQAVASGFVRYSDDAKAYIEEHNPNLENLGLQGLVTKRTILSKLNKKEAPKKSENRKSQVSPASTDNDKYRNTDVSPSKLFEIAQLEAGQRDNISSSLTVQLNTERLFSPHDRLPTILFELAHLLKENPAMCSYYDGKKVYYYDEVNIGVALDLDNQLKVPVIQKADGLSIADLEQKIAYFIDCYLDNKFSYKDLTAGSFTVTDLSGENIFSFQPLINGLQSAILGIGMDSELPGKPMTLTMVFDHKVHSGAAISNFLNQLKFRLSKYSTGENASQDAASEVVCSKCFTDVKTLHEYYKNEAVMYVNVDEKGKQNYICHICSGGY